MDVGILRAIREPEAGRLPARLIRAARSGLRMSMLDLALAADVSVGCVNRIEADRGTDADGPAVARMRRALEAAGAEFGAGEGTVMLRLPPGRSAPRRS